MSLLHLHSFPFFATGMDELPRLTTQTVIGIAVAISGNVLISLALNLQKLAHKRVDVLKNRYSNANGQMRPLLPTRRSQSTGPSLNEHDGDSDTVAEHPTPPHQRSPLLESQPLLPVDRPINYTSRGPEFESRNSEFFMRIFQSKQHSRRNKRLSVHIIPEDETLRESDSQKSDEDEDDRSNETAYLKSKLWYVFILTTSTLPTISFQVDWLFLNECRRARELYILRVCPCIRSGSTGNCE
jgi:hypothetical protein